MLKNIKKYNNKLIGLSLMTVLGLLTTKSAKAALVSFSCPQPLLFGGITACSTGPNTVVITSAGGRTLGGCLSAGGAPFSNAACNLVQDGLPRPAQFTSTGTATLTAGANTVTINGFNLNSSGATYTGTGFFISVPVGATMTVPASQPGGTYTGSFTVNAVLL